ncbi:hypothetical protein JCM17823_04830 [Halorubrum gandharaense]
MAEYVDGSPLRFRVAESGLVEFADAAGALDDDVPPRYRHAVRTVRERLDREAVRTALDDPTTVTFAGVATHLRNTDYDWDVMPGFLGTAVHDADREQFLPPDTTQQVFEHVGLAPVRVVDREVRCVDVDPDTYSMPDSAWRDGPAAGVVFTNKAGGRAVLRRSGAESEAGAQSDDAGDIGSVDQLFSAVVTDAWLAEVADEFAPESGAVAVDAVVERAVERLGRETRVLEVDGITSASEIRSALAERAGQLPATRA